MDKEITKRTDCSKNNNINNIIKIVIIIRSLEKSKHDEATNEEQSSSR